MFLLQRYASECIVEPFLILRSAKSFSFSACILKIKYRYAFLPRRYSQWGLLPRRTLGSRLPRGAR
jgi:hypothetical protein